MTDISRLARDEQRNEQRVRASFWHKARRTLGRVPFSEDAVAAFYCATDSATPLAIRAMLFGALAYFVLPFDVIPDMIAGLGYTDDAAVILAAVKAAQMHITPEHRRLARAWLVKEQAAR
jgi:uncharacterized membrane protein YkvA (DUF1232 family)